MSDVLVKLKLKDIKVNNGDYVSVHIIHLDTDAYAIHVNTVKSEPVTFKWGQFLDQGKFPLWFLNSTNL